MAKSELEQWEDEQREEEVLKRISERRGRLSEAGVSEEGQKDFTGDPEGFRSRLKAVAQTIANPVFGAGDFAAALGTKLRTGIPLEEARRAARIGREEALLDAPQPLEMGSSILGNLAQMALPASGGGRLASALASKVPYLKKVAGTIGSSAEGGIQGLIGSLMQGGDSGEMAGIGSALGAGAHAAGKAILPAIGTLSGSAAMAKKLPEALREAPKMGSAAKPASHYADDLAEGLSGARFEQVMNSPRKGLLERAEGQGKGYSLKEVEDILTSEARKFREGRGMAATDDQLKSMAGHAQEIFDAFRRDAKGGVVSPRQLNEWKAEMQKPMEQGKPSITDAYRSSVAARLRELESARIPDISDYNRAFLETENALENVGVKMRKVASPGEKVGDIDVSFKPSKDQVDRIIDKAAKGHLGPDREKGLRDSLSALDISPEILDKAKAAHTLNFYRLGNMNGSRAPQYGSQIARALGLEGKLGGLASAGIGMGIESLSRPATVQAAKLANLLREKPWLAEALEQGATRPITGFLGDQFSSSPEELLMDEAKLKRYMANRKSEKTK